MGNQHSGSHAALKPRKNVHWKSAGRPAVPGKPDIIPLESEEEPNAISLRWAAAAHDGGAPLLGYQVECNRLGSAEWVRTAPPLVLRPELVLSGLEPPHRYQFRVAALNAVGNSDYSALSDVLTVSSDRLPHDPPLFLRHLEDVTALENDKTEFRVSFAGIPAPTIAWFKDDYEIFSSRRTAITTSESSSVLVFHQTLASDEGEVKCTATNRAGHAVTRARLRLEAAPKLRYPRQYEDGLLYEINETVFLKLTVVGKPAPDIEWSHDGRPLLASGRVEISNTPKFSILKIHSAQRSDRGEYQIHARNAIGEDTAAFLVTITAPPEPPRAVSVARQVDKSLTLAWEPPEDDGGCRIGNYVVEYYRTGWNVWLKATTSRQTSVTLFDLIEGSEYRFRVKAESPYGMSAASAQSAPVRVPGRPADAAHLAAEARILAEALRREDGDDARADRDDASPRRTIRDDASPRRTTRDDASPRRATRDDAPGVSPAPRRRRAPPPAPAEPDPRASNEFMLVLYPDNKDADKAEKRKSFQLELEEAASPPPLSLSAPELSGGAAAAAAAAAWRPLRHAVSSTELLHERAMARFYQALALQERRPHAPHTDIPYTSNDTDRTRTDDTTKTNTPTIYIKSDSIESREYKYRSRQASQESDASEPKWGQMSSSFDDDYTASTASTEGEGSDEGSLDADTERGAPDEPDTYSPRDKLLRPAPLDQNLDEEELSEKEVLKPLPLPDPNFIPKPILKRREPDVAEITQNKKPLENNTQVIENKPKPVEKPKKEDKMTIFKKFTKMPVQKSFPFPKILSKKEPEERKEVEEEIKKDVKPALPKKVENVVENKISDEGRTVIDYYTNIVKEYGGQKKNPPPLCLNTEDLKTVAEKQEQEMKEKQLEQKKIVKKKAASNKSVSKAAPNKTKAPVSNDKQLAKSKPNSVRNTQIEKNHKPPTPKLQFKQDDPDKKCTQKIVLKTTERATIVIPIDYQQLEETARVNVRSAIDYAVDLCLLLLAFWVYLFKDERLAVPFLVLIIYRQLQETLLNIFSIPEWIESHTPAWLKKKTS